MIDKFLNSNSTEARLARTILQGLIGVLITSLAVLVGWLNLSPQAASILTAVIMCFLSPIMALLKNSDTIHDDEIGE